MTADDLTTVFTTRDALQAEMVRLALQEEGIAAALDNPLQAGFTGVLDVNVKVQTADADRARQVLSDLDATPDSCRLIVMTFNNVSTADEVQLALGRLERSDLIDIQDSVVIVRNLLGELSVKQMHHLTRDGALAGGLCGALLGAMFVSPALGFVAGVAAGAATGALTDIGIDDHFLEEVGESLRNMSSALVVLVRRGDPDKVKEELKEFEGTVIDTTLIHADEDRFQSALARHGSA